MRNFKFRAWHKGYTAGKDKHCPAIPPQMLNETYPGECFTWLHQRQPLEIMQATNLRDKNGKEIFEGDILEFDKYEWNRSAVKSRAEIEALPPYCFSVKWDDAEGWIMAGCPSDMPVYCEIVGNIYETPELLTQ